MDFAADGLVVASPPVVERVHAFFAPVNRTTATPTIFDPAVSGLFNIDTAPSGWIDLGYVRGLTRVSGTAIAALRSGSPLITKKQTRTNVDATLSFEFESWGKLQMGLSCGSQHMNLLQTVAGVAANGSGGHAVNGVLLQSTSDATHLNVGVSAAAAFAVGDVVVVDVDYAGEVGYVGSGVSAAYVRSSDQVKNDPSYIRRVSYNIGRVVSVAGGVLTLGRALVAGTPIAAMKVAKVLGFVDREGGSFFQEWSALFVMDGVQGDRVIYHYPRLQAAKGATEEASVLSGTLQSWRLWGSFRALPVADANDGESIACYRTYLPAAMREV